jgi:hypothetical protein
MIGSNDCGKGCTHCDGSCNFFHTPIVRSATPMPPHPNNLAATFDPPMPLDIDGDKVIYYVAMPKDRYGLTESEAMHQDMPKAYAVVSRPEANAGIMVYGHYRGKWIANPGSSRFLIRHLLEKVGITPTAPQP